MSRSSCNHVLTEDKARELLEKNGLSKTKTKLGVLMKLSAAHSPLSVAEIHRLLGEESCDVSTVFRTITQFKEKNLVREYNLGEDFFRYEVISEDHSDHHHHHVRCRQCGTIKPLPHCDLSAFEKAILKLGFKEMEHHLEFTGVCARCHS